MPIARRRPSARLYRAAWLLLVGLAGAIFLLLPREAEANAFCATSSPTLAFGTSLTGSGQINWTCTNFDTAPISFTLCAGIGNPSFPGTTEQPKLIGPSTIDFNVYVDSAAQQVWRKANPLTRQVTLESRGVVSGSFTFYGRIASGQVAPVGDYSAFFYNTVVGFIVGGACQANGPDLAGQEVTLSVTASIVENCTLGTIGEIDFGELAGLRERIDAAGSVQLICPISRAWTLSFDGGRHVSGTERRMRSTAGDLITYQLYRDSGRSNPLEVNGSLSGTGTGTTQTVPVYGRVEIANLPPIGQYSDFIVVTLGF